MPDDPPPAPTPPEKPAAWRPSARTAGWQAAAGPDARAGRNTALLVAILLFAALAAALAVFVFVLPTPPVHPYLVSVPVDKYDHFPPNPWANQDADLLGAAFPKRSFEKAVTAQQRSQFLAKLAAVRAGEGVGGGINPDRPFILHVTARATAADGTVYLLPADARPDDPSTWVKIDDVLDAMAACPVRNKLLVLDVARPAADPFAGPLADDVADRLDAVLSNPKAGPLPFPVLTACSPGEVSHVIPDARASAFAFYLTEGLRGAANGYGSTGSDENNKVTVRELAEFLRVRVGRWAGRVHDAPQEPKLYGSAGVDFPITLDPKPWQEGEEPAGKKLDFAAAGTLAGWQQRDGLSPDARRHHAAALARWEAVLLRTERVYAASAEANRELTQADGYADAARRSIPAATGRRSLPELPKPAPGQPDPVKGVRDAFNDLVRGAGTAAANAGENEYRARRGKFADAAAAQPELAARVVWDWLRAEYPTAPEPRTLWLALDAAEAALGRGRTEQFLETAALRRVASAPQKPDGSPDWNRAAGHYLTAEAAAAAVAAAGPTGFAWVADAAAAADRQLAATADRLFAAKSTAETRAAAEDLEKAGAAIRDVRDRLAAVAEARAAAADAIRLAAATAYAAAEYDTPPEKDWLALADRAAALAEKAYRKPPPAADWTPAEFRDLAAQARDAADAVRKKFDPPAVKALLDQAATNTLRGGDLPKLWAALAAPPASADDRRKLWDAAFGTAARLHQSVRKDLDAPDNEAGKPVKPGRKPEPPRPRADLRAEVAVRLLAVAGHPDAGPLDAKRKAGAADFAAGLRDAWGDKYRAALEKVARDGDWPRADRLARAFPAGLSPGAQDAATAASWRVAADRLRAADAEPFDRWLADRGRK